jgi:Invasion associated locus B (IalB) protein
MVFTSKLRFSCKYIFFAAALGLAAPALANGDPKHLGDYKNWSAYVHKTKVGKVCFAISEPKETLPKKVNRDPVYFLITNRPKEKIKNEVSVITGYPYKSESISTARIGDKVFKMYTKGDGAWVDNAKNEKRLIKAMKDGKTMIVKGTSKRGTVTTDKYSLVGITAAISSIDKSCR